MNTFRTLNAEIRRNLLVLFATGLLFWASLASLLPTLPLYVEDVGATKQEIGIVIGCFAIGLLLFRSPLGILADRHSRKIVLLIGMVVTAIAPLGYLFVHSIPLLILVRAFHGISIAAFGTGYSALVVDLTPERKRGEVIGYMSLVNPVGMAVGPAMGGFLQEWAGHTPLFLLSAGLGFVGLLCTLQVVNPPVQNKQSADAMPNQFWRLLGSPRVRTPALVLLLVGLAFGTLATFVPLFIKSTGVNLNAGLFYTAAAVSGFIVRIPVGRASDRYGRGVFITGSLILYTLAMVALWNARSAGTFLLAGLIEGGGGGILIPMVVTLIADRSLPHERGRMLALCLTGFDLGIAIAGPVLGAVAEQAGYRSMFGFAAGLTFMAIIIFLTQSSKDLAHSLRFALGRDKDVYALNQ